MVGVGIKGKGTLPCKMPKVGHLKAYLASLSAPFTTIIEDLIFKGGAVRLNFHAEGTNWWVAWKTHRFCELGGKMVAAAYTPSMAVLFTEIIFSYLS